jgi:hypothetical protein
VYRGSDFVQHASSPPLLQLLKEVKRKKALCRGSIVFNIVPTDHSSALKEAKRMKTLFRGFDHVQHASRRLILAHELCSKVVVEVVEWHCFRIFGGCRS